VSNHKLPKSYYTLFHKESDKYILQNYPILKFIFGRLLTYLGIIAPLSLIFLLFFEYITFIILIIISIFIYPPMAYFFLLIAKEEFSRYSFISGYASFIAINILYLTFLPLMICALFITYEVPQISIILFTIGFAILIIGFIIDIFRISINNRTENTLTR